MFFRSTTTCHSKKTGNRPPRPYPRPALRGGVYWREGAKRPPAFIQQKNRTSGLPWRPRLHCPSSPQAAHPSPRPVGRAHSLRCGSSPHKARGRLCGGPIMAACYNRLQRANTAFHPPGRAGTLRGQQEGRKRPQRGRQGGNSGRAAPQTRSGPLPRVT